MNVMDKKKARERIFVYQAVELKYLDAEQLLSCIEEQEKQAIPIPLLTICKQKGYLKPSQVNHLMSKRMDKSIAKAVGEGLRGGFGRTSKPQQDRIIEAPPITITTSEKEEYERLIAAKDRLLERLQQKLNERNQLLTNYEKKKKQALQDVMVRKESQIESLESELACYRGLYEKSKEYESKLIENSENLKREKESSISLKKLMIKLQEDLQVTEERLIAAKSERDQERNSADFIKGKIQKEIDERKKLKEKYQVNEDNYIKIQNKLVQTQNELEILKKYYEDAQKTSDELGFSVKDLKNEKEELLLKMQKLEEDAQKISVDDPEYKEFFDVAEELKNDHEEENAKLKDELEKKQKLEQDYQNLQKKYQEELHTLNSKLQSLTQTKEEQTKYGEDLRKEIRILEDQLETEKTTSEDSLYKQKTSYETEMSHYKQKNETLENKLEQFQSSFSDLNKKEKEVDIIKEKLIFAQEEAKKAKTEQLILEEKMKDLEVSLNNAPQMSIDGEWENGTVIPGSGDESYEVQKLLGRGGMGLVYSAIRKTDKQIVVIKTLFPEGQSDLKVLMRFVQEARTVISFDHENLIEGYDLYQDKDLTFFVMEYLDGDSLEEMLDDLGLLDVKEATEMILGIAKSLQYLEENCLVHRDVKPSNIIITDAAPKLVDFGIVKMTDRTCSLTTEGIILGTPYYLSPEQTYQTNVDIRSDIYSLGATFYHMVVGEVPFPGDNPIDVIQKRLERSPRPGKVKPDLPKPVCAVIEKMMNKNVKKRQATACDLVSDLQKVLEKISR